jgi:hypothetical protein
MVEANLRVSESNIISASKKVLDIAREHIKQMSLFGITEYYLSNFELKILECEDFINRDIEIIELKDLTNRKYKALEDCYNWGRQLALRVEIAFGKKSEQFDNFPSKHLLESQKSDEKMLSLMEVLISISKKYSVELFDFGQTVEVIEEGLKFYRTLRIANAAQEKKKDSKKESTKNRREKFYDLYEIVNKINKVGRTVYKSDRTKKNLFKSYWKNKSSLKIKSKILKGNINPLTVSELAHNIRSNKKIKLSNTGECVLHFFYSNNSHKTNFKEVYPTQTLDVIVRELGEGNTLKVENIDQNIIGKYKVEI